MTFSDNLQSALKQLYHMVEADIPDTYSPSETAEAVVDGQKLFIYGFQEEQKELEQHFHDMSYDDYLSLIAKVIL